MIPIRKDRDRITMPKRNSSCKILTEKRLVVNSRTDFVEYYSEVKIVTMETEMVKISPSSPTKVPTTSVFVFLHFEYKIMREKIPTLIEKGK